MALSAFDSAAFDTGAFDVTAFLFTDAGVLVPDVVGQAQAVGTTTLQSAGFVVAVTTAYSSVVPAGTIISQSPLAGAEVAAGSTVTIVVSLGDAPAQGQAFTGGGFFLHFEYHAARRRKRQREIEEAEEESQQLKDETEREIALLLREQERKDEFRANLERLNALVRQRVDAEAQSAMSERVQKALARAMAQESISALIALQRELDRMFEEEEIAVIMLLSDQ